MAESKKTKTTMAAAVKALETAADKLEQVGDDRADFVAAEVRRRAEQLKKD